MKINKIKSYILSFGILTLSIFAFSSCNKEDKDGPDVAIDGNATFAPANKTIKPKKILKVTYKIKDGEKDKVKVVDLKSSKTAFATVASEVASDGKTVTINVTGVKDGESEISFALTNSKDKKKKVMDKFKVKVKK